MLDTPPAAIAWYHSQNLGASSTSISSVIARSGTHMS